MFLLIAVGHCPSGLLVVCTVVTVIHAITRTNVVGGNYTYGNITYYIETTGK